MYDSQSCTFYPCAAATALLGPSVPDGTGQIWLDDVACTGTESRLIQCGNRGLGVHNCAHSDDAGVRCTGNIHIQHEQLIIVLS